MDRIRKLTLLANFLAIAIVLNIIESAINVIPVPGAKLGFANVVTLIIIYVYSFKDGITLTIARVLLVAILSGKLLGPIFYMSLSGAVVATLAMGFFKKTNFFGILGVSVIGSIFHTIGQIAAGIFVIGSIAVVAYLPIMLFLSIPAGILTGIIARKFYDIWET
ncbi:MAG: Gx transporter family protein, partial [Bacillota bacterium]